MKTAALLILCLALAGYCQTVTTNYVTAPPNFRKVNGQLYNIDKSEKWLTVWIEPISQTTNGLKAMLLNPIYPDVTSPTNNQATDTPISSISISDLNLATPIGFQNNYQIFILNAPDLPRTKRISLRLMPLGTNTVNSESLEAWEFGKPYTVATVRTNAPPTNAPAVTQK